jgi:deoxycytidylate deaminase|tara:strand:- start:819 stop:1388 length:570 start_codon:yes stop_codon:yes gene_type:complete
MSEMKNIVTMVMAEAAKSNIDKRQVGCVILGPNGEIYGVGHNIMGTHAECMALEEISRTTLEDIQAGIVFATAYVSHQPCKNCAMKLLEANITNIIVIDAFMKFDTDKLRYDLIPPKSMEYLAKVLTFGAKKYKPNNWKNNTDLGRYESALMRHFEAYRLGEYHDEDSGLPHLAHALTNLVFLLELTDD